MVRFEREYESFIRQQGVGERDRVASSPKSYLSYLRQVAILLGRDISPDLLATEASVGRIVGLLRGKRSPKTLSNYASALRLYARMVAERRLKPSTRRNPGAIRAASGVRYWRMSFRIGNQGDSLWQDCVKRSIAIITYRPLHNVDLRKHPEYEPANRWGKLGPAQRFSLGAVAYNMRPKDIIFAKEGPSIVGRGVVQSGYRFDPTVLKRPDVDWGHHVKVDWRLSVPEGMVQFVGPRQSTVHQLTGPQVQHLEREFSKAVSFSAKAGEAMEGRLFRCVRNSRARNMRLVQLKKTQSDYTCEICAFNFEQSYGELGRSYIVVHHLEPIGSRRRATRTRLEDLVVLCPNCHVMLHRKRQPLTLSQLRAFMGRN